MENIVEMKNLSKTLKKQQVLKDITMRVPQNCVYGLLGPNGAGKSTLLKMLAGMLKKDEGEIRFRGHEFERKDLREIGSLIETPPIYENLTARENMEVRALMLGVPMEEIQGTLETAGISDTGRKKAGVFSLGMKQRLGIALALLGKPRLLILDEPTNGLDPIGILELREQIRSFPEQGITVIVSSHLLSEISQMADYIGILADGRLQYEGWLDGAEDLENLFLKIVKGGKR